MLFKASTSAAQVTGCLPLPVSHLLRISVFICTGWFKRSCAIILTLEPFLSSRRKMPNRTYLVAIFHSNVDHHSISACDYFGNCIRQLERKTHTPTHINSQLSSIDQLTNHALVTASCCIALITVEFLLVSHLCVCVHVCVCVYRGASEKRTDKGQPQSIA